MYLRFEESLDEYQHISTELIPKTKDIQQVFITTYVREKEKHGIWGDEKKYPQLCKALNINIKQVFSIK